MGPHVTDWLTKPIQMAWTGNQPIFLVIYISVFCLHNILRNYDYSLWDLICPDVPKKVKWLRRSTLNIFLKIYLLTYCAPPFSWGIESPNKFSKSGPDRVSILRGRLLEKNVWLFWGGEGRDCSCYVKSKLDSEIWNNKKKKLQLKMFFRHNWKFKLANFN